MEWFKIVRTKKTRIEKSKVSSLIIISETYLKKYSSRRKSRRIKSAWGIATINAIE